MASPQPRSVPPWYAAPLLEAASKFMQYDPRVNIVKTATFTLTHPQHDEPIDFKVEIHWRWPGVVSVLDRSDGELLVTSLPGAPFKLAD